MLAPRVQLGLSRGSTLKQPFQVGDKAVYPVHGVAEVVAFEKRDIGGAQTSVYILKIIETGLKKGRCAKLARCAR